MSEKQQKPHSLNYDNNTLTVKGVVQVVEISEKEAVLKLSDSTLTVKGSGLNVTKLDKEQGVVVLETATLINISYRQGGLSLKGLFK